MKKIFFVLLALLVLVTSVQIWVNRDQTGQKNAMESVSKQDSTPIGGAFTLVDQEGKTRHDTDFRGQILLVAFGFTHCPDICPVTVATLSKTMEQLQAKSAQVTPLFITIDPQRDTSEVMKEFLSNFDKRIVGLTGTELQIKQVADAYKIYYARAQEEANNKTDLAGKNTPDYNVDHSGYIYMMGKDGQFMRVFAYNVPEQEIISAVEAAIQ